MHDILIPLLEKLLVTHSPTGVEDEIDQVIQKHLGALGLEGELDPHGNITVRVAGRKAGPTTMVAAHKDELGCVIRKIDEDGKLWLEPLGGCRPFKYGEGPFDILTRDKVIPGVLCLGSTHSSALSSRTNSAVRQLPSWDVVYVECRMTGAELREAGVRIGDRAVIGRSRKTPLLLGKDTIGGYALDDKGGVAVLLLLLEALQENQPLHDVSVVFSSCEESGCSGLQYACQRQDVEDVIAVEVSPMAEEYPVVFNEYPVLLHKDSLYPYSLKLSRALEDAAATFRCDCQGQVVRAFGSDSSAALKAGVVGRAACIGFPTFNTHGYEMAHLGAIENCIRVLTSYLTAAV